MSRFFTFGRRVAAGFAIAILLVLGMGIVALRSADLVAEASGWVSHTHVVIALLTDIDGALTDAESADRGFALTGDETFLQPEDKAKRDLPQLLARLSHEVPDNPEQVARLGALEAAVRERLDFVEHVIRHRREGGLEAAAALVGTRQGADSMRRVRAIVAEMAAEEQRLLAQRNAEAAAMVRKARTTTMAGMLGAALLVTVAGGLITRSLTARIGSAVQHLQSSATELESSASEQATTAKEQASSTTEITATIRELSATSRQIAEATQRVASLSAQTGESAKNGESTLRKANEGMSTIRTQVDAIVAHMLDLGKKSQQIGDVLEIINELAEQTNILAINATIEAAGAAEDGRRFGALAEEIRKLADRVAVSTKEIRALVEEIRGAANTTVMATEQGAKATDAGTRQFADLAENFRCITGLVLEASDSSREIELSTRQQATAVEQVSSAMFDVSRSAGEVESMSRQTVDVAAELADLARELARIVRVEPEPDRGAG